MNYENLLLLLLMLFSIFVIISASDLLVSPLVIFLHLRGLSFVFLMFGHSWFCSSPLVDCNLFEIMLIFCRIYERKKQYCGDWS